METREVLEKVQRGEISVEEAEHFFRRQPFEEMGYAKLDMHRKVRSGFAEVIYCSRKADDHLLNIFERLYEQDGEVFGTRASEHQYELIRERFPQVQYDPLSHILKITKPGKPLIGKIAVCTAGTADISVAEEAAQTAEYFGTRVERIYDVGVSGIHRLLSRIDVIQDANCIIAVAGMEGALASVLGGLVDKPVIAVPTSVGYGASLNGMSALLTMINSCANGIAVVNIDNGYGAGYLATQINRLAVDGGQTGTVQQSEPVQRENSVQQPEFMHQTGFVQSSEPIPEMTSSGKDQIVKLESNIDDCSGEVMGYVMERLFEAGARDVSYMPIFMKKNRPAYQLNVICTTDKVDAMEKIIFSETTTIGIRRQL
ncbi:MAG: nickel pincer cofactor biosynthesis protein LarB, partial [Lachnospiraceae bacterium]